MAASLVVLALDCNPRSRALVGKTVSPLAFLIGSSGMPRWLPIDSRPETTACAPLLIRPGAGACPVMPVTDDAVAGVPGHCGVSCFAGVPGHCGWVGVPGQSISVSTPDRQ